MSVPACIVPPVARNGNDAAIHQPEVRIPMVVCGPADAPIPQALRDVPSGFALEGSDPAEALRALLAGAGARAA